MPLPGGDADKVGNRYEARWTVYCMAEVLESRADYIRLEPLGDDAVEFYLQQDGRSYHHQVKRQRTGRGRWTLAELNTAGVLPAFFEKLAEPEVECCFVSMGLAGELLELAERARKTETLDEFQTVLQKRGDSDEPGTHGKSFESLRRYWSCTADLAWERLKRVQVRAIDEDTLRSFLEARLAALVEGDPSDVVAILAELVLDRVHETMRSFDLWQHLEAKGHHRRDWAHSRSVLAAVDACNEAYLRPLSVGATSRLSLVRPELRELFNVLDGPARRVLVTGVAGSGKSTLIACVVEELKNRGCPFLACRIDELNPVPLPKKIGKQLDLPGSPTIVLGAIAQGGEAVLIVDQLDAVSSVSGRHPAFLRCVEAMISEASAFSEMKVIILCREFDFEYDTRLRQLFQEDPKTRPVVLKPLDDGAVDQVVSGLGLDPQRLDRTQRELLRVPLHLKLLAEVLPDEATDIRFQSATDLYALYWDRKQHLLRERSGRDIDWTGVIESLCAVLSNNQMLSAPKDVLDRHRADADILASDGVIVLERDRWRFFHEGFFDYSFARRFAEQGQDLLQLLLSGEQHLFRRAQVRQVLAHLRGTRRGPYYKTLEALLTSGKVRFHIKAVVCAWLGNLPDPTSEEWSILEPLIQPGSGELAHPLQFAVLGAPAWFKLLDNLGTVRDWLASPEEAKVEQIVWALWMVHKQEPARVAVLLHPFLGRIQTDDAWRRRFLDVVLHAELALDRSLFDLFLELVRSSAFPVDGDHVEELWGNLPPLAQQRPEWACEALACILRRALNETLVKGETNPFQHPLLEDRHGLVIDVIHHAAEAPLAYCRNVIPELLDIIAQNVTSTEEAPARDHIWRDRRSDTVHDPNDVLLEAAVVTLGKVGLEHPACFRETAARLRASGFETAHYLLIRAYTAVGERAATEAVSYVAEDPSRLLIGYSNSHHMVGKQLLEAVTPYVTPKQLRPVERWILNYHPDHEQLPEYSRVKGMAKYEYLTAIPEDRLTAGGCRTRKSLSRKFAKRKPERKPRHPSSELLTEDASRTLSDDDWLELLVPKKRHRRHSKPGCYAYSSSSAADLFSKRAHEDPTRFATLMTRLRKGTPESVLAFGLRAIAGRITGELALKVARHCRKPAGRSVARSIIRLLAGSASEQRAEQILKLLCDYAAYEEDCPRSLLPSQRTSGEEVLTAGINTVRGAAAVAIGEYLRADIRRLTTAKAAVTSLVEDRCMPVRACAAGVLLIIYRHDAEFALGSLEQLARGPDELLATAWVEELLSAAAPEHWPRLEPLLRRMLGSPAAEVATVGARQICRAALIEPAAADLAASCLTGGESQRLGAATIYSAYVAQARFRSTCEAALAQLFQERAPAVATEAARCFRVITAAPELGFASYTQLIRSFVQSRAFVTEHTALTRSLERSQQQLPEVTIEACERFVELAGDSGMRQLISGTYPVSRLVIRLYEESVREQLRSRCLNLVDRMIARRLFETDQSLKGRDR